MRKGDFLPDGLAEVYLQDALLPQIDRFAFMAKLRYRVRMAQLRGVPSECLIMPKTVDGEVGDEMVGATKYEKLIPASMGGDIYSAFPSFIHKTDAENHQAVPRTSPRASSAGLAEGVVRHGEGRWHKLHGLPIRESLRRLQQAR